MAKKQRPRWTGTSAAWGVPTRDGGKEERERLRGSLGGESEDGVKAAETTHSDMELVSRGGRLDWLNGWFSILTRARELGMDPRDQRPGGPERKSG